LLLLKIRSVFLVVAPCGRPGLSAALLKLFPADDTRSGAEDDRASRVLACGGDLLRASVALHRDDTDLQSEGTPGADEPTAPVACGAKFLSR
jgi:hypothetical protein